MAKMGISCKVSLLLQGLLQELLVPLLVFLPFCRVSSTLCWMTLFQLQTDRDPLECLNHLDFNLHVQTCSGLCDSVCYFLTNCMDVIIWSSVFFLRPCSIFCLFFLLQLYHGICQQFRQVFSAAANPKTYTILRLLAKQENRSRRTEPIVMYDEWQGSRPAERTANPSVILSGGFHYQPTPCSK